MRLPTLSAASFLLYCQDLLLFVFLGDIVWRNFNWHAITWSMIGGRCLFRLNRRHQITGNGAHEPVNTGPTSRIAGSMKLFLPGPIIGIKGINLIAIMVIQLCVRNP